MCVCLCTVVGVGVGPGWVNIYCVLCLPVHCFIVPEPHCVVCNSQPMPIRLWTLGPRFGGWVADRPHPHPARPHHL